MDKSLSASTGSETRYVISGELGQEFTRVELRDRIRVGALNPGTEVALAGTENWTAASQFPELARYFSLAGKSMSADPALMVEASSTPARHPVEPVTARLIPGLAYPLTSVGVTLIVVLTIAQQIPIVNILGGIFGSLYSLYIIKSSARGDKVFPALNQLGNPVELILLFLKLIVVSLVSGWPIFLAVASLFVMPSMARPIILVAMIVTVLYYPACLATLAVWNSIKFALTPSQIFSFIRILGADHVLAILAWFCTFAVAGAVGLLAATLKGISQSLVLTLANVVLIWGSFYSSHILGWAVARHRNELD